MIGPRWRKVLADLRGNKLRTLLVVASITIGVFNVGLIVSLSSLVDEDMTSSYLASEPHHAVIYSEPFDENFLISARRVQGVSDADGRRNVSVKLITGPDEWVPLELIVVHDFKDMRMDLIEPERGGWPPHDNEILIEEASMSNVNAEVGDWLDIELLDGSNRKARLAGVAWSEVSGPNDPTSSTGFVTFKTLDWLHEDREFDQLILTVEENADDKDHIQEVADRVADKLKKAGKTVAFVQVPKPGERPGSEALQGVITVLGILAMLSVLLSGFLIFSSLSALLAQHVKQIGIMKAIGARAAQIIGMYVMLLLIFGILAIILAVPLGTLGAYGLSSLMGQQFHYETLGFRLVPQAVILQVLLALLAPLVTGIIPVYTGSRISVHEAISGYGMGSGQFGQNLIDRLVERIRGLSRPLLISLRNTFRRKGRLALTLITLTLGGAIFIGVFSVRVSLVLFLDQFGKYFLSDVNIGLIDDYHITEIEQYALSVPGVVEVEGWAAAGADLLRDDGTASENAFILAPPAESTLVEAIMIDGRWIVPGDENALVVSNAFWNVWPDLKVGDEIELEIKGRKTPWRIIGFFQFPGDAYFAYTDYEYLSKLINAPNRASQYRIIGEQHSPQFQKQLTDQLRQVFNERGIDIESIFPGNIMIESAATAINVIMVVFLVMAVLIALVGAIGLMGTMSMNVLERTREIGVLRAIGANNRSILMMVIVEGMIIGLISWVLAALLAVPVGRSITEVLFQALFKSSATYGFTAEGFIIWLVMVVVLSLIASIIPAWNASRVTVRDALAYE